MHIAYLTVVSLFVGLLLFSAIADFVRYSRVLSAMARAGVPEQWLPVLGGLKAAGALGLLVGMAVPTIGLAASVGLGLYFIGAIVTHIRARWFSFAPLPYLALSAAVLVLAVSSV